MSTLQEKHGKALLASTGGLDKAVSARRAHEKYADEICMAESDRAKCEMCGRQLFARRTNFQKDSQEESSNRTSPTRYEYAVGR